MGMSLKPLVRGFATSRTIVHWSSPSFVCRLCLAVTKTRDAKESGGGNGDSIRTERRVRPSHLLKDERRNAWLLLSCDSFPDDISCFYCFERRVTIRMFETMAPTTMNVIEKNISDFSFEAAISFAERQDSQISTFLQKFVHKDSYDSARPILR